MTESSSILSSIVTGANLTNENKVSGVYYYKRTFKYGVKRNNREIFTVGLGFACSSLQLGGIMLIMFFSAVMSRKGSD